MSDAATDKFWEQALNEAETPGKRVGALWAKAFADAKGDEQKATAAYISARVAQLLAVDGAPKQQEAKQSKFAIAAAIVIMVVVLWAQFGPSIKPSPIQQSSWDKAQADAKHIIDGCWQMYQRKDLADAAKRTLAGACYKYQEDFYKRFGYRHDAEPK